MNQQKVLAIAEKAWVAGFRTKVMTFTRQDAKRNLTMWQDPPASGPSPCRPLSSD